MKYFTYILKSLKTGKYYIGSTNNLESRLKRHNSGKVISTKNSRPWIRAYFEESSTLRDSRAREAEIKRYKSGNAFKKLVDSQQ